MIIAGAKCDKCGKVETMNYTDKAVLEVMLRQRGWGLKENKTICRICNIAENNKIVKGT